MAKNKKLKVLSMTELNERFKVCFEQKLCFITKEPLDQNNSLLIKHPELGNVQVNLGGHGIN